MELVFDHFKCGNEFYIFAKENKTYTEVGSAILKLNVDYNRFKDLCNGYKCAYLCRIETKYSSVGKGVATSLMNKIFEMFPEYNFYLCVIPRKRGDKDMNYEQLKSFYSKFGFVRTKELTPTMFRKCKKV